jgi:uncharacterized membrane protein
MRRTLLFLALLFTALPLTGYAQELIQDTVTIQLARVEAVSNERIENIPGTDTPAKYQTLSATILDGAEAGKLVTFENDYTQLKEGEKFYIRHTTNSFDGTNLYSVAEPYRLTTLLLLAVAFVALIFAFGGIQGVRGLASLIGSVVLIFLVLIPGILQGYSPVFVSIGVAGVIIIVGSYITHGFNKTTSAAVLGMLGTVAFTGLIAFWTTHAANLSGFNEETMYLNFDTRGNIDLIGLLFGGIMIGLLGVLYDIAIGQSVAVEELFHAGKGISRAEVFKRGMRIGREHIGALVNTLAIAYVGASLPLLLLVQSSSYGLLYMINSEVFATEIVRILIGSIGLVLAVPITTYIASRMFSGDSPRTSEHSHAH